MKSRPTKQKLKQRGILRERVFGCDLGEHLLNSGHDVPQVLKSCTEFIEKHGVVDGMYRLSGIASNIQKLRHEFDSEQIPDLTKDVYIQDIHCVGSLCKLYFRELPNPLLTYQLYEKFSDAVSAATDEERLIKIHDVIQQLPPPHYRTLEFLMRHLAHLATFSYVTNMHTKNLAIVWAPNLLRSKQIESACFSGTAAFMEVRIQSVVVEFILNHVDVLFSPKLSSLIREGTGHNSLSRPKSLLVPSPSTKLLTLEEAQARTQAQINSPITADSKYIEVGEGPAALQGKFHTVIEFPTERKRPPAKPKKSPVGSWRSFFNLGKASSISKRKLQRNPSEPNELKAMALAGGRGDTGTLRSAKSEESLTSLHNVEGESKVYRPRRPRSSSDALSASFNGELLDNRQHCNSYGNVGQGDSDGDDGPICVPALISPPRSADDVDLSPPDIGMASLDFDPMSFQCSLPLGETSIFSLDSGAPILKRSPGSANGSEAISPVRTRVINRSLSPIPCPGLSDTINFPSASSSETPSVRSSDTVERCVGLPPPTFSETASSVIRREAETSTLQSSLPPSPLDSPVKMSSLSRTTDLPLSEAIQQELLSKAATLESKDISSTDISQHPQVTRSQEEPGALDSPEGTVLLSSVSFIPPPPPPQNAARMLALALAESAQQAAILSQRESSGPPTPVSPLKEGLETPDLLPVSLQSRQFSQEATIEGSNTSASESSPPPTQPEKLTHSASLYLNTADSGVPRSTSCNGQDVAPPLTCRQGSVTSNQSAHVSEPQRSPERQQPAVGQTPVSTTKTTTTALSSTLSSKDKAVQQSSSEIHAVETPPQVKTRTPDQPVAILHPQIQTQPHLATHFHSRVQSHPKSQPNARVEPMPAAPHDALDKPWEAIKPVHPKADCAPQRPCPGPTPPTPPVRSIDSKLAMAALINTDAANPANFHAVLPESTMRGSADETLSHPPHRRSSAHQSGYIYQSKGEAALLEPTAEAYYHQRGAPSQASMAYHYRPESVPPHAYVSKSEPQITYRSHGDGRYNTIGPRSFHHSFKSRGPLRGEYCSPSSVHHTHGYNSLDGPTVYPTIRRVHSIHVPPSGIRSMPVTRTEVPPDDELFYYQRPVYHCKSHQQSSQADYHVTQLQPYFENGRVQYRYSPYSGSHPPDVPYYDMDHYGTVRLRHVHSFSGRDSAPLFRSGVKSGVYHYLSRNLIPVKEHDFVSRDMPPYSGSKGIYFAWDPEEAERLRVHSIRRESRARQKMKGSVMSQYDNVAPFMPVDVSGLDLLHLRSKSDPGKPVLRTAEGKEGRCTSGSHMPRHLGPDPDAFMYMETEKHCRGNGMGEKTFKQGNSRTYSSIHSHPPPPPQRSLQHLPESGHPDPKFDPGEKQSGAAHRLDHSEGRNTPRYERSEGDLHVCRVKASSSASEDLKPAPNHKAERSHSVRERQHYNQSSLPSHVTDASDRQSQRQVTTTLQSHYDNLDDYHPAPQSQTPTLNRSSHHNPGFSAPHSNQAYSTALGQGAFVQTELLAQRPETEINAE